MNIDKIKKLFGRLIPTTKPKNVLRIEFDVMLPDEPENYKVPVCFLSITYILSNENFIHISDFPAIERDLVSKWNDVIKKTIKNYLNITVIIYKSKISPEQ